MPRYKKSTVDRAKPLLQELEALRRRPPSPDTQHRINELTDQVVQVTGSPTVEAARWNIYAYEKARAEQKKINKSRSPRKQKKTVGSTTQPSNVAEPPRPTQTPITVIRGGLPGSHR